MSAGTGKTFETGNSIKVSVGAQVIGGQQNCSLSMETETYDATTKDSGVWSEEEAVGLSWSIDCDGLIVVDDAGLQALMTAWKGLSTVDIKYGTTSKYKSGKAIVESISQNSSMKEKSTWSVTFKGVGELTDSSSS